MSKVKTERIDSHFVTFREPEHLDRLPPDWFALDVMPEKDGSRNWVALLVDVDPDDLKKPFPSSPLCGSQGIQTRASQGAPSLVSPSW
jgi:hypothetical protein